MKLPLKSLPVWIVNLNRCHDRWQRCFAELAKVFQAPMVQRVDGVDGFDFYEDSGEVSQQWDKDLQKSLEEEGVLLPGHVLEPVYTALCLSHRKALRQFLNTEHEWGVIFEDDARVEPNTHKLLTGGGELLVPEGAELLFLHDRVTSRKSVPTMALDHVASSMPRLKWQVVDGGIGLEAYAVNRAGAKKILSAWQPVVMECDLQLITFLEGCTPGEDVEQIHSILGKKDLDASQRIKAYALNEPLFFADERLGSVKLATIAEVGLPPSAAREGDTREASGPRRIAKASATRARSRGLGLRRLRSGQRNFAGERRLSLTLRSATARRSGGGQLSIGSQIDPAVTYSFCITAKERLDHLRVTLPHNIEVVRRYGESELVLLNYNSQDGLEEFVLDHFKAELRSGLLRLATTKLPQRYHYTHAKNVCHRLGRGEFLINLDADQFLNDAYMEELNQAVLIEQADVCTFVYDDKVYGGGFGRVAIHRDWFKRLGGYDEDHHGYGEDDFDLVERAKLSHARVALLASATAEFLRHGDERRVLADRSCDRGVEAGQWKAFFEDKWAKGQLTANHGREWGVAKDLVQHPSLNALNLTVILTNYKRPDNIGKILDSIPDGVEVILLDNAPSGHEAPREIIRRADWYVRSDGNDLVLRWLLAAKAKTRFFCVQDDDLCIKDWRPYVEKMGKVNCLVGPFGVDLQTAGSEQCYSNGSHALNSRECDVIKGRAVFGRVRELRRVLDLRDIDQVSMSNDDVFISSLFHKKHQVVEVPNNIIELRDNDAISRRRWHLDDRDLSAIKFFFERSHAKPAAAVPKQPPSRGVVLCASSGYHTLALRAMESLQRSNVMLPVHCHPAKEGRASREAKLSVDQWSPFGETLFIDCDTVVCADLSPVFDLLKDAPLYMAKETPQYTTLGSVLTSGWIWDEISEEYLEELSLLPADTPQWNSGVILFRKEASTHDFFESWRKRWQQRGAKTLDQLPLMELVVEKGRPAELPPYWHCQVSSQNPQTKIPKAAIYHFMGMDKESSFRRWQRAHENTTSLTLLSGE